MYGVSASLGPQLMAEIGDVSRFHRRENLTAFAGVDPGANQSGKYEAQAYILLNTALQDCVKHCFRL